MHDYHRNIIKSHYKETINLINKGSFVYYIETDNFYHDLKTNPKLLNCTNTANLPRDHSCFVSEINKIPGMFLDEIDGRVMREFIALRAVVCMHNGRGTKN
uniref:Uncharacterized protein n=1 Tax=Sipha flava TaxID=143950 RepID=A0A2S2QC15_9HEMI